MNDVIRNFESGARNPTTVLQSIRFEVLRVIVFPPFDLMMASIKEVTVWTIHHLVQRVSGRQLTPCTLREQPALDRSGCSVAWIGEGHLTDTPHRVFDGIASLADCKPQQRAIAVQITARIGEVED